jgi:hypothetical protein
MARLTDTQLVILSTASRRNDRGVDLPTNVTDEAVRKAVDKLIHAGLRLANQSTATRVGNTSLLTDERNGTSSMPALRKPTSPRCPRALKRAS